MQIRRNQSWNSSGPVKYGYVLWEEIVDYTRGGLVVLPLYSISAAVEIDT